MTPEKKRLLDDLWTDESADQRASILATGGTILRRKRRVRLAVKFLTSATTICLVLIAGLNLARNHSSFWSLSTTNTQIAALAHPNEPVQVLTDDDLLALFPGVPVGLAVAHGKKHLIFPRPQDQATYVVHWEASQDAN